MAVNYGQVDDPPAECETLGCVQPVEVVVTKTKPYTYEYYCRLCGRYENQHAPRAQSVQPVNEVDDGE